MSNLSTSYLNKIMQTPSDSTWIDLERADYPLPAPKYGSDEDDVSRVIRDQERFSLRYHYKLGASMIVRRKTLDHAFIEAPGHGITLAGIYAWGANGVHGIWTVREMGSNDGMVIEDIDPLLQREDRLVLVEHAVVGAAVRQPRAYIFPRRGLHGKTVSDVLDFAAQLMLIEDGVVVADEEASTPTMPDSTPITDLDHMVPQRVFTPGVTATLTA